MRAAGDIAKGEGADTVTIAHVISAKKLARTLEQQIADRYIVQRKKYSVFKSEGSEVGRVNGLAIIGIEAVYYYQLLQRQLLLRVKMKVKL